jgi:hypothetical protein
MTELWVKYGQYSAVPVSTEGCRDVIRLINSIKKELAPLLDVYASAQLSLSLTVDGTALEPDDPVPAQNTARTPLFISVTRTTDQGTNPLFITSRY